MNAPIATASVEFVIIHNKIYVEKSVDFLLIIILVTVNLSQYYHQSVVILPSICRNRTLSFLFYI